MIRRIMLAGWSLAILLQPVLSMGSAGPLETYQARAQQFYRTGVDELALVNNAFNPERTLLPGMLAPDFSLMDLDGAMHTLSELRGSKFVVIHTGNAT